MMSPAGTVRMNACMKLSATLLAPSMHAPVFTTVLVLARACKPLLSMTVARSRLLSPCMFTPFSILLVEGMFEDDEQLLPWHEMLPFCEPSTVVVSLGDDGKTLTWPSDWFCDTSPLEMTESPKICGWGTARTEEPTRARSRSVLGKHDAIQV